MSKYKEVLAEHETAYDVTPCLHTYGIWGRQSSYLDKAELARLRADIKTREHNIVPNTNRKATWYEDEKGGKVLRSYYTDVVKIYRGRVYKLWKGYSVTTLNHINEFLWINGYKTLCKHDWVMLEAGKGAKLEKRC